MEMSKVNSQRLIRSCLFHSNQIMLHQHINTPEEQLTIFLPAYLNLKVKSISQFQLTQLQVKINCTISLAIYYGDLPHQLVSYIKRSIYLLIEEEDEPIQLGKHQLDEDITFRDNQKEKVFSYVLKKKLQVQNVHPYLFLTPYEIIDCILTINVRIIPMRDYSPMIYFKVNLMDDGQPYDNKFIYTKEISVHSYGFAQNRRHIEFTNNSQPKSLIYFNKNIYNFQCLKTQEPDSDESQIGQYNENISEFRFAHYHFPLYKFPTLTIGTIFLPLLILTFINLSIFFESTILSERIANIAMLMIAFLALIPVVHSQMPVQRLTLLQILVYLQISTTSLCLLDSVLIRNEPEDTFVFHAMEDPFFVACMVISIIIFSIVLALSLIYTFFWKLRHRQENKKFGKFMKTPIDRENWRENSACNEVFSSILDLLILEQEDEGKYKDYIKNLKVQKSEKSFVQHLQRVYSS